MTTKFMRLGVSTLLCSVAFPMMAQEPEWNPAAIKACDRACLIGFMDGYMNALFTQDLKVLPPLSKDLRIDRKSTRLNSSHRTISYAVFCSKKKKKVAQCAS